MPCAFGMRFTAFVSDVFSRRIVGWRVATSMPTELPLDALEMALWIRARGGQSVEGLVHHLLEVNVVDDIVDLFGRIAGGDEGDEDYGGGDSDAGGDFGGGGDPSC